MRRSAEVVLGSPVWGAAPDSNSFKSSMRQSGSLVLFRVYPVSTPLITKLFRISGWHPGKTNDTPLLSLTPGRDGAMPPKDVTFSIGA